MPLSTPGSLEASDVCTWSINRLLLQEISEVRISGGQKERCQIDGIHKGLIKEAALQDSQALEIVLDENVVVVGFGGYQRGIP
jgi:hypothetical protein